MTGAYPFLRRWESRSATKNRAKAQFFVSGVDAAIAADQEIFHRFAVSRYCRSASPGACRGRSGIAGAVRDSAAGTLRAAFVCAGIYPAAKTEIVGGQAILFDFFANIGNHSRLLARRSLPPASRSLIF